MKWKRAAIALACCTVIATACGAPAPAVTDVQIDQAVVEAKARFEELGTAGDRLLGYLWNYQSIITENDTRLAKYGTTDSRLKIADMVGMLDVEEFLTGELGERSRRYEASLVALHDATILTNVFPDFAAAIEESRKGNAAAKRRVAAYRKLDRFRLVEDSFNACSRSIDEQNASKRVTPLETSMHYITSPEQIIRRFDGADRLGDHFGEIIAGLTSDLDDWKHIEATCLSGVGA